MMVMVYVKGSGGDDRGVNKRGIDSSRCVGVLLDVWGGGEDE